MSDSAATRDLFSQGKTFISPEVRLDLLDRVLHPDGIVSISVPDFPDLQVTGAVTLFDEKVQSRYVEY